LSDQSRWAYADPHNLCCAQGAVKNNSALHDWDGKTAAREGDVIGLLLDLDSAEGGSLTVFKNGAAKGTAVTVI
jgi:hypothetical protein